MALSQILCLTFLSKSMNSTCSVSPIQNFGGILLDRGGILLVESGDEEQLLLSSGVKFVQVVVESRDY